MLLPVTFDLPTYLRRRAERVDRALSRALPPEDRAPVVLHKAMRYSVEAGGKRLRPVLCLAACEAVGGRAARAMRPALALEALHTYTLIHDDLPCMDDDALRRGRPTCHVVFGEANALLAGDALLTLAFEWMAQVPAPPPYPPCALALELARATGHAGTIAGQCEDLAAEGESPSAERVDRIHRLKTGALLRASVRIGGIVAGASAADLKALSRYGESIGLAFQIADDLLNATGDAKRLGKAAGSDAQRGKMTYVAVHGLEAARRRAERLAHEAVRALQRLPGPTEPLEALAYHMIRRDR